MGQIMNFEKFNDHVVKLTKSNLNHNLPDSYKIIETITPKFLNFIQLEINNPKFTSYSMMYTYWKIYHVLIIINDVVNVNMDITINECNLL